MARSAGRVAVGERATLLYSARPQHGIGQDCKDEDVDSGGHSVRPKKSVSSWVHLKLRLCETQDQLWLWLVAVVPIAHTCPDSHISCHCRILLPLEKDGDNGMRWKIGCQPLTTTHVAVTGRSLIALHVCTHPCSILLLYTVLHNLPNAKVLFHSFTFLPGSV